MTTAELVRQEQAADVRWGVYLTVRELELAARVLGRGNTLMARTLAQRFREKAHLCRSCLPGGNADA